MGNDAGGNPVIIRQYRGAFAACLERRSRRQSVARMVQNAPEGAVPASASAKPSEEHSSGGDVGMEFAAAIREEALRL
jgi:hypothetical protein